MPASRLFWYLAGLGGAVALYVAARTPRGQVTVEEFADDTGEALEGVTVTAQRIVSTVAGWLMPASGAPYRADFEAATRAYNLPPGLIARQAWQESRYRPDIVSGITRSSAGALGIMQIIPRWHPELSPGDAAADASAALDPHRAIDYAGRYLRSLFNRFGSWRLALAAYNAGPENVKKYGGIPPFRETQAYVRDIARDVGLA